MINIPNTQTKAQIIITSLARGDNIVFFPYDFDIDDSYKPQWGEYESFGRMDPIMIYKKTTRDVNLSFNVVAENEEMAKNNFKNLQILIKNLYPTYEDLDPSYSYEATINKLEKLRQQKANEISDVELALQPTRESGVEDDISNNLAQVQEQLISESQIIEDQILSARIDAGINAAIDAETFSNFGVKIMNKSPLFKITFMNLLNNNDYVIAVTNFKHKMKFDAADTSLVDGNVIPGEFSINLGFKVLHNNIPGTKLNYGF